ncbi:HupE/UreJ family protein [Neptunicella marina]|uniref:HupE/UreJ family protein n=1 Tax=Neptunicella marina TaxID=2125989 RepID=A0A8J6IPL6_9ALTE|nr:HupE/UreJ family protein [Neptunicella marina]MBC3764806.1 HupE/UreJ family protein [Neptunicella marina]
MRWLKYLCLVLLPWHAAADEIKPGFLSLLEQADNQYQVSFTIPFHSSLPLAISAEFPAGCEKTPVVTLPGNNRVTLKYQLKCSHTLGGEQLTIKGLQLTATDVLLRVEWLNGELNMQRFTPQQTSLSLDKPGDSAAIAGHYTVMGIEHILIGWDHLLFILCLVFIARQPKRIIVTATGFTLAHSLTLVATSLNWVSVPIAPVEAVIALSILFLATELCKHHRNSLTWRYPALVASTFGLIHGFGFASVLSDLGLPEQGFAIALLFFNVGVELGQLIFIAFLLCVAWLYMRFLPVNVRLSEQLTAYFVGSISAFWVIERTLSFI